MFGQKKDASGIQHGRGGLSVIGADMTLRGDLTTEGNVHIDGTIEGDISCGSLIQGQTSHIAGIVRARTARLSGSIKGEVIATTLTILATARIDGDVSYETLSIDTGAQVDGRMTHVTALPTITPGAPDPLRLEGASDDAD